MASLRYETSRLVLRALCPSIGAIGGDLRGSHAVDATAFPPQLARSMKRRDWRVLVWSEGSRQTKGGEAARRYRVGMRSGDMIRLAG